MSKEDPLTPDFQMLALEARYARLIARMLMNVSDVEDCMKIDCNDKILGEGKILLHNEIPLFPVFKCIL